MASLRSIKKEIDYLVNEVITDCYLALYFHGGQKERIVGVIEEAVALRNDLVDRVNRPEDKHNSRLVRKHYRFLREQMFSGVDGLFGKLSEICKTEQA